MCQEKSIYIFCTCDDKTINSEKDTFLNDYYWELTKYIGKKESLAVGKIVLPKENLGNGLTLENILNQLNTSNNNFDFDYDPAERDCLKIAVRKLDKTKGYFKVIYRNKHWVEGENSVFTSITETVTSGKIKTQNY